MIDDIILVSDEEIKRAILTLLESTHQLAEGTGAASTAAAFKIREKLQGKKVALVLTGGNLTLKDLNTIFKFHSHPPLAGSSGTPCSTWCPRYYDVYKNQGYYYRLYLGYYLF
jgi:threonine synthase